MKNLLPVFILLAFLACQTEEPEPVIITEYVEVIKTEFVEVKETDTVIVYRTVYVVGEGDTLTITDTVFVTVTETVTIIETDTVYVTDTVTVIKTDTIYINNESPMKPYTENPWEVDIEAINCNGTERHPFAKDYSYFWTYQSGDGGAETMHMRYRIHFFEDESSNYRMVATSELIDPGWGYVDKLIAVHYDYKINFVSEGDFEEIWNFDEFANENFVAKIICRDDRIIELEFEDRQREKYINEDYLRK